jgi:hypothetical protein
MPSLITDVSTFTDPISVPTDGDPVAGPSLALFVQGLSNRSRWLKNLIEQVDVSAGKFNYATPVDVTFQVPIEWGNAGTYAASGSVLGFDAGTGLRVFLLGSGGAVVAFPIAVPAGSTLKSVTGRISMGTAGAPGQMTLSVWRHDGTENAPLQLGATSTAAAGTGYKNLTVSGLSEVGAVGYTYSAAFKAGSGVGVPADGIYGVTRTLTDRGPR